jgi:hypothetical protein
MLTEVQGQGFNNRKNKEERMHFTLSKLQLCQKKKKKTGKNSTK